MWLRMYIYTASNVKHRLNDFLEKTETLSKLDFFLVTFVKLDKVVTLYNIFLFDYRKGEGSG